LEFGHIESGDLFPPLHVIEEALSVFVGCEMWDLDVIVCRVETSHALRLNWGSLDDDSGPANDKEGAISRIFLLKMKAGRSWDS
jgi:hypothetical protein